MIKNVLLLVNPYSGKKEGIKLAGTVRVFLDTHRIEFSEVVSQYPGHFSNFLKSQELKGLDAIIIIGGDGTMSEVVNAIFQKSDSYHPPILLLPAGGGNALNHDLNSLDFDKTLQKILNPKELKIDIIKLKSENELYYCFNIVGWGLVAEITQTSEKLRFLGGFRYFFAALLHIFKNPKYQAQIIIEGKGYKKNFCFAFFSNTQYTGKSMKMSPLASLTDGKIDMVLVPHIAFWKLLLLFPKIFDGSHISSDKIIYLQSKKAKLLSESSTLVVDGEVIMSSPFELEIVEKQLKILI